MSTNYAQFELSDGSTVLMEVAVPENTAAIERVGLSTGTVVLKAKQKFEESLDEVRPVAAAIVNKFKNLQVPADEIEVKFGLKFTADAGMIFSKVGGEVNFEITLKWSQT
jgi:hypothetical protein